jgi:hypothetical protein
MTQRMTDEQIEQAARAYRASLGVLPPGLDDRVLDAGRLRGAPQPSSVPARAPARRRPSFVRWLLEPQQVRPAWGVALAAAAALVVWVARRPAVAPPAPAVAVAAAPDTIYVRFELAAPAAADVALAGSFNAWGNEAITLTRGSAGTWSVTVPLPVGEHRYSFVVDGETWVPDPRAHAQIDDGFGGTNSVIVVGPKGVVRS